MAKAPNDNSVDAPTIAFADAAPATVPEIVAPVEVEPPDDAVGEPPDALVGAVGAPDPPQPTTDTPIHVPSASVATTRVIVTIGPLLQSPEMNGAASARSR